MNYKYRSEEFIIAYDLLEVRRTLLMTIEGRLMIWLHGGFEDIMDGGSLCGKRRGAEGEHDGCFGWMNVLVSK